MSTSNQYTFRNTTLFDFLYSKNQIPKGWESFFNDTKTKEEIKKISDMITQALKNNRIEIDPPLEKVFEAFKLTPKQNVKAIIIGQDPAPELGLAQGIAFSIPADISTSRVPSVQRILLEVQNEKINVDILNGNLVPWARQGVLLLNETLTISCDKEKDNCYPDSHKTIWENFTPMLLSYLNDNLKTGAYILWGQDAQKHIGIIDKNKFKILIGGHPSPLAPSEDFFCKNYFTNANKFLEDKGLTPINWNLTEKKNKISKSYIWSWSRSKRISLPEAPCSENSDC